jgi:predicted small metal-binding protein
MNPSEYQSHNKGKLNFRCADVGPKSCDWQVSGDSEEEMMPKIEQHGREKHNMHIDEDTKRKVRSAIQRKAA